MNKHPDVRANHVLAVLAMRGDLNKTAVVKVHVCVHCDCVTCDCHGDNTLISVLNSAQTIPINIYNNYPYYEGKHSNNNNNLSL